LSRPVIAICAAVEHASWGRWELEANVSPRVYALAVQRADALALILPPDDAVAETPDEVLDLVDALVIPGGSDIDPASYGARPCPETHDARPERDRFELALAHRALVREMPVLGICRGMELLNVALGGTLEQHIDRLDVHRHTPGAFGEHEVRLEPDSLAARAVGAEHTTVKSHHHQALAELGEGLVATGWSEPDDLVEAVEVRERPFVLGVLWHPEEDERSRVISTLVQAARERVAA
jgi:putative glutamine amidotransferase